MSNTANLVLIDWIAIAVFLLAIVAIGLSFIRRGSQNMQSFFISDRRLTWPIAGISIIATSFASDTPLWVSSLVRRFGIQTIWQYWVPFLGFSLSVALFARLWRRLEVVTDIEFIELRYSGKSASVLRFYSGFSGAILICPLIISWVTKAMETITREAIGLPPGYQGWTIAAVLGIALITCTFSGLWGVVYTDLLQFTVATIGTLLLAIFSVQRVGGLQEMVTQLRALPDWSGQSLSILPKVGPASQGLMSIWNMIGYFGLMWIGGSLAEGYTAQRLLACKDEKHATYAQMLNTVVYWGVLAWPWIIVALCSLILLPDLGADVSHDSAYPRMILLILPYGLRGLLIAALIAAFISTINTLFNWGSSYLVNDVYKRFFRRQASDRHYVVVAKLFTVFLAVFGGYIATQADSIQQLLEVSYVLGSNLAIIHFLRWFWPRLNAAGELIASITAYVLVSLLLAGKLDSLAGAIFNTPAGVAFHQEYDYLGARMILVIAVISLAAVIGSVLTRPTDEKVLAEFVRRAQPLAFFWKRIIRSHKIEYRAHESVRSTLATWVIFSFCVFSLIMGFYELLLGTASMGVLWMIAFVTALLLSIQRVNRELNRNHEAADVHK